MIRSVLLPSLSVESVWSEGRIISSRELVRTKLTFVPSLDNNQEYAGPEPHQAGEAAGRDGGLDQSVGAGCLGSGVSVVDILTVPVAVVTWQHGMLVAHWRE